MAGSPKSPRLENVQQGLALRRERSVSPRMSDGAGSFELVRSAPESASVSSGSGVVAVERKEPDAQLQWGAMDLAVNETDDLKTVFDERSCNWTALTNRAAIGSVCDCKGDPVEYLPTIGQVGAHFIKGVYFCTDHALMVLRARRDGSNVRVGVDDFNAHRMFLRCSFAIS